jgi:hypothetical protein
VCVCQGSGLVVGGFGRQFVAECVAKAAALARQSVVEADTLSGYAGFGARSLHVCVFFRAQGW